MTRRVFIRTDASFQLGLGHVVRCLAVGHMLKSFFKITFLCRLLPEVLESTVSKYGFDFVKVDDDFDWLSKISKSSCVILDGYHFSTEFQQRIKSCGCILICLDDLHDRHFVADIVINQAPGVLPSAYSKEPYTLLLLGPAFALLRPSFLAAAGAAQEKQIANGIVICFGGSDFRNLTIPVLKTVLNHTAGRVTCITGAAYEHSSELSQVVNENKDRVEHLSDLNESEMLQCLLDNRVAIVPASGVLMEALAAGCVVIGGYYAENQKDLYHGFLREGAIIGCDDFSEQNVRSALELALHESSTVQQHIIVDGKSGDRVRDAITKVWFDKNLQMRPAELDDCRKYFEWVNEPGVRRNSVNQSEVTWSEHQHWFETKLQDTDSRLHIFHLDSAPVGQVRFELKNGEWMIDYSIDKQFRGQRFAYRVVERAITDLRSHSNFPIVAFVKESNLPSIRVFERMNFAFQKRENGFIYFRLDIKKNESRF